MKADLEKGKLGFNLLVGKTVNFGVNGTKLSSSKILKIVENKDKIEVFFEDDGFYILKEDIEKVIFNISGDCVFIGMLSGETYYLDIKL